MDDPFAARMNHLVEAVFSGPGFLDGAIRRAAAGATNVPAALATYVEKIHRHAYKITDEDVAALHRAGYSDDQIFEVTVSAALGAGLRRLEAGLGVLQEGK